MLNLVLNTYANVMCQLILSLVIANDVFLRLENFVGQLSADIIV